MHRIAEAITAPWSSDRAITNDSAEIVDSDAVSGDSDGQDTDDKGRFGARGSINI